MKIHPVTHEKGNANRFCGPSAISAITGMPTGDAARLIRIVSGKRSIKGTGDSEIRRALARCNVSTRPIHAPWWVDGRKPHKNAPTLAGWFKQTVEQRSNGRVFLIVAGHHWQVVSGRRYVCGLVEKIVSITAKGVKRRAKVQRVYEVTSTGIKVPAEARKSKTSSPANKGYTLFTSECRRHKLKYKKASDGYIEIEPSDDFPDGLTFLFDGWDDAYDMLMRAFRHPEDISEDGYLAH